MKVLVFLSILATSSALPPSGTSKHVCATINITESSPSPAKIFEEFAGCQVIEGSIYIENIAVFKNASLPSLVEVTGFVALHDVHGFHSLSTLFPSLTIIRGNSLYKGYGLALDGLCSHEFCESLDFDPKDAGVIRPKGLTSLSLLAVLRGDIWVCHNKLVCLEEDMFKRLASDQSSISIRGNLDYCPFSFCTPEICATPRSCSLLAQGCPYKDKSIGLRCHEYCLEGACQKAEDPRSCVSCVNFYYQGECVKECPEHTLEYLNYRCLSVDECRERNYTRHGQRCQSRCPKGFIRGRSGDGFVCQENKISGICESAFLENGFDLGDSLRNCDTILGDLEISINSVKSSDGIKTLSENLANLRHIHGRLRIFNANVFLSLQFLSGLLSIGSKVNQSEGEYRYVLFIFNNENLRELFIPKTLLVLNGPSFIGFNDNLYNVSIEEFKRKVQTPTGLDIISQRNGEKAQNSISHTKLFLTQGKTHGTLYLSFFQKHCGSHDMLIIGYNIFYRIAPGNFTKYEGRQACSAFTEPWSVKRIDLTGQQGKARLKEGCFAHNLTGLKTNTRYAVYIESFGLVEDQIKIMSNIAYASTFPEQPECPKNVKAEIVSDKLKIYFDSPSKIQSFFEVKVEFSDLSKDSDFEQLIQNSANNGSMTCDSIEKKLIPTDGTRMITSCTKLNSTYAFDAGHLDSCNCESDLPPLSYYREKEELRKIIYGDIQTQNKVPPLYRQKIKCSYTDEDQDLCSAMPESMTGDTFWHFKLLPYEHNDHRIIKTTEKEYLEVNTPSHMSKFKITISVRGVIRNVTDCDKLGLGPRCGITSDFSVIELKPPKTEFVANLKANLIENMDTHTSQDYFNYNVSFEVPELDKRNLILGYKLLFGPENAKTFNSVCFSSSAEENEVHISYKLSLPNSSGKYKITLLPLTLSNAKEAETFIIINSNYGLSVALFGIIAFCTALSLAFLGRRIYISYFPQEYGNSSNPNYNIINSQEDPFEGEIRPPKFDYSLLKYIKSIGDGEFAKVHEYEMERYGRVAVKALKIMKEENIRHFRKEISITYSLRNSPFVVSSIGYSINESKRPTAELLILELLELDLKKYLKNIAAEGKLLDEKNICEILVQVNEGLDYIHSRRYIHRDISARNILVVSKEPFKEDEHLYVKISDFGLARSMNQNDYYKHGSMTNGNAPIPVLSMAPEILRSWNHESTKHTVKSDIYSFGLLSLEIVNYAKTKVYDFLYNRLKLENPGLRDRNVLQNVASHLANSERFIYPFEEDEQENRERYPRVLEIAMKMTAMNPDDRISLGESKALCFSYVRPSFKNWFSSFKVSRKHSESSESGYSNSLASTTSRLENDDIESLIESDRTLIE